MTQHDPIFVTRPSLPPLEDLIPYLENIWNSKVLTNGGPLHRQLEKELCKFLGVKYISLFANGTLALTAALKSLDIQGEVITTPYTFVATSHSILLNNCSPVFVDIDPVTCNLDASQIEAAITPRTTAIVPVHCYGNACETGAISTIARRHGLQVIYDAAHAFAVNDVHGSLLNHGDLSVLSFHATKVFNTFEGGAIVCHDAETKQRIDRLKNFGFSSECSVVRTGFNGKMNELQAAVGLAQIPRIREDIERRRAVDARYRAALAETSGVRMVASSGARSNYSYFPVLIDEEYPLTRDALYELLKSRGIYARRYFYPLVTEFAMYRHLPSAGAKMLPAANDIAERVLCLPIYPDLPPDIQDGVIACIKMQTLGAVASTRVSRNGYF